MSLTNGACVRIVGNRWTTSFTVLKPIVYGTLVFSMFGVSWVCLNKW